MSRDSAKTIALAKKIEEKQVPYYGAPMNMFVRFTNPDGTWGEFKWYNKSTIDFTCSCGKQHSMNFKYRMVAAKRREQSLRFARWYAFADYANRALGKKGFLKTDSDELPTPQSEPAD